MTTDPILSREDFGLLMEALSKEITLTAPLRGLYDHDAALRTRIAELEGLAAKENSYALSILRERLDGLCTALGISKNVEATDGLAILFEQLTTRAEKAEAEIATLRDTAEVLRGLNAHHKEWHPACARCDDIERAARAALSTIAIPDPRADALLRVVEAAREVAHRVSANSFPEIGSLRAALAALGREEGP